MWKLQGGSYIPGFSRQAYGAGLQRDVTKTRKDQAKKAAALQKYMSKRSSKGKWAGNIIGAGVGVGLGAMGMGPLGLTIGKTLGAGLGSRLGSSKMLSGEGPSMAPGAGTGLLGSTYEQLGEAKGGIDEAMRGQAYGAGAAQLASGLTGMAGDKLGAQLGDMFGKWKAGRTGLSGFEPTGIGNALGLDASGAERLTPGMSLFDKPASMTGYSGFVMNPAGGAGGLYRPASEAVSSSVGGADGGLSPFGQAFSTARESGLSNFMYGGNEFTTEQAQQGGYMQGYQSGGALGKAFGLGAIPQLESRSSKWFTPEAGSEMAEMQEKLRGMAGEGRLFDPETGDPMELTGVPSGVPEEAMLERIKGAAGSMFNPFHGVEKESPMQRYAKLSPKSMSLLEEYGGKDEPEREPFDLMGKLGGLGRGAGNLLSSVINPFHGMEREARRSPWTGQPMQMGGMMPGGVSNALPYQEGGEANGGSVLEQMGFKNLEEYQAWFEEAQRNNPEEFGMTPQEESRPSLPHFPGRGIPMGAPKYSPSRPVDPRGITRNTHPRMGEGAGWQGMQQGGSISPYNLGGSVTQQPMAYQLGGLLKYKRSPMMG